MPRFAKYSQIAIVNNSTDVNDADGSNMTAALNNLLPIFCNDWSIPMFTAMYIPKRTKVLPSNMYLIYLLDTSDISGALAYHDLSLDVPYGKVFVKTVLSNNGVILYDSNLNKPTVAQTLAHEVFELIIDPRCNTWWMNYKTGVLVAAEVVDPVELNVVVVTLKNGVKVGMCDWILPSWQDAQNTTGPFNHMNTLTQPFQVKNGYAMVIKNSKVISVYGDTVNPNTNTHCQLGDRASIRALNAPNMS
jgi:hypothetical protein